MKYAHFSTLEAPRGKTDGRRFQLPVVLCLLFCLVGVSLISRYVLIHNSLRLDESQTLWQASHSIRGLFHVVALDVHVPLYHLIVHFWLLFIGRSITSVRLLSLIFFMINIPVFYIYARQFFSRNWSMFATVLFSFSPFMNWYANEARMYTLLALVATLSQYYFIRIMRDKKGWLGYTITALIGSYVHYFFAFNLAVQGLFFLFNRKKFAPGSLRKFIAVGVLVIAELTPWLLYFHSLGSGKNTSPALLRPSSFDFFNAFSQFAYGFQNNRLNTILGSLWPISVIVALLAVRYRQQMSQAFNYALTAGLLPVLMAFGLSYVLKPFFVSRYMIACIAPLTIVVVWFISHYRKTMAAFVILGLSVLVIFTSYTQATGALTPVKENYEQVAATVNAEAEPQDEVILSTPFTIYPFEYYYHGQAAVSTLPIWDRRSSGAIPPFNKKTFPAQVAQLNNGHRYVFLVLSYDQGYETQIHNYYEKHYKLISSQFYSHDLNLYVYQVGYDNPIPLAQLPNNQKVTQ